MNPLSWSMMNKMANFWYAHTDSFSLFTYQETYTPYKESLKLDWRMVYKVFFSCGSIRVFAKNMGDPHYEPTIVVHDMWPNYGKLIQITHSYLIIFNTTTRTVLCFLRYFSILHGLQNWNFKEVVWKYNLIIWNTLRNTLNYMCDLDPLSKIGSHIQSVTRYWWTSKVSVISKHNTCF